MRLVFGLAKLALAIAKLIDSRPLGRDNRGCLRHCNSTAKGGRGSVQRDFFAIHDQPYEEVEDWDPNASDVLPPYFGQ